MELNPKDFDAYTVYSKLLAKSGEFQSAAQVIQTALQNCGQNGDLYYIQAQIAKLAGNEELYTLAMAKALENHETLTVNPKLVKNEYDKFLSAQAASKS